MQTLKDAESLEAFRGGFEARLVALGKAHDLLSRARWADVSLQDLFRRELEAFEAGRTEIDGPEVRLAPAAALAVGLLIHELAVNAVQHGAMSAPDGRISVQWRCDDAMRLSWIESGGPAAKPPAKRGFGLRLLERSVARDLNGAVSLAFDPGGMRCEIVIPLDGQSVFCP